MRTILKRPPPSSLVAYRQTPDASYANLPPGVKDAIRSALLVEQGYLCCYCMRRIDETYGSTRIEHWTAQSVNPGLELDWDNLLAVCNGSEGEAEEHCDRTKADLPIVVNPTVPRFERLIGYLSNGEMHSSDRDVDLDLTQVLRLNVRKLSNSRVAYLSGLVAGLARSRNHSWTPRFLERQLHELSKAQGRLDPFCQVGIHWILKRLARA